jgi:cytochrome c5
VSQENDSIFIRNFILVLGLLVAFAVGVFVLAQIVTGRTMIGAPDPEALKERIKPIGQVNTSDAPAAGGAAAAAPVDFKALAAAADAGKGEPTYNTVCMACHATGAAGAPKLGDQAAWTPRIAQGMEVLLQHSIQGFNAMPAKGGRADMANEEIAAATAYLVEKSK